MLPGGALRRTGGHQMGTPPGPPDPRLGKMVPRVGTTDGGVRCGNGKVPQEGQMS